MRIRVLQELESKMGDFRDQRSSWVEENEDKEPTL